ncbi:phosphotransferase family protein [Cordyceps javanica]|uniref:Phosphotransferase family protein n=1 Tax=Cordyceps javanica TaxID=43265 RepID=A0A545V6L2_9HYPO|nr:phosphotransferase family protein [Cordyceps javanica]TQW08581.1 phosphotransferase family protein [Cordyceps javanica]
MISSKANLGGAVSDHHAVTVDRSSSFFREKRAPALPSPSEIRLMNSSTGDVRAENFHRPTPVRIPSLGLLVKYGADVSVCEAQTQQMVREKLADQVPVPEIFGWTVDGGQVFIYMQLIEGDTLQARWANLDEVDRRSVCPQLRHMVDSVRSLPQENHGCYIGSLCGQPLNDIFLQYRPELVGPFKGPDAVEQFHRACDIDVFHHTPTVFTHADLVAPNILLSTGANPTVVAIIDWAQAGWYPDYWEYCKARRVELDPCCISREVQEEWRFKYLPLVMDVVDEEACYHPWLRFVLSRGF